MPELPEVEITARLLDAAVSGAVIAGAHAPGVNTLKSFDPPLHALTDSRITGVQRRGKHLIVESDRGLALLVHLMSAGRLQLYERPRGRPRAQRSPPARPDRALRLSVALDDGRELRLRELGSRQAAWAKLVHIEELPREPSLARLGPDAWREPPGFAPLLDQPRPLHALLRDQRVLAGIGRAWADEVLWEASLSPYKRGSELAAEQARALRDATVRRLGEAIAHYERHVRLPIPHRLPVPLLVHGHAGEPCPRGNGTLHAVHFEGHVIAYCPACQTAGRILKDRRLSRLLR
jgi:formamidopyrimidine-DNA glycosylase